ncbi:MAG: electron transfer flavoprotein subunit alpha/FixB family protein [Candidatus Thermoplasmatota archaeon]|nr:electron transfer flavoprotein subunit alpha/FixB family protein [Candidatus Thermoplasmatota archaeon]
MSEILVLAEHRAGKLRDISLELVAKASELATQLNAKVTALILGWNNIDSFAKSLSENVDEVLVVKDKYFDNFNSELCQSILTKLILERKPILTLIGHTSVGIELAPNLAIQASLPLVTDCIELKFEDSKLKAVRQLYGGKISASVAVEGERFIATVRSGVTKFEPLSKAGKITVLKLDGKEIDYKKFISYIEPVITGVDITKSDVIVAVGRGIKDKENLQLVEKLASCLGGALAGSRPVIDKQWLGSDRQVGSSGKTVKPKLYFAIGISGAFQHVMGMKDSETIVAINKDPNAPIFDIAHYGIVGDLFKVVPVLTQKINELKSAV